eukprot:CAMPEP_0194324372 /NCGR_PEP_ID=MMETSP0171-20130528/27650_1 /TAXON_ID=218684 /ORGANISM="Corethron pennatum, Strain L29A3" /LENGTH=60 /DNA_ID=CAMNT_0039083259 /DNA_START=47 /DNA_END=226 /DNA_ORIENTATION=+
MFTKIIAAIALLANAVSVDGACSEDAEGVVTIPADWTDIPWGAFRDCKDLKKVLIPAKIR